MAEGRQRIQNFSLFGKLLFLPGQQERPEVEPVPEDGLLWADEPGGHLVDVDLRQRLLQHLVKGQQFS